MVFDYKLKVAVLLTYFVLFATATFAQDNQGIGTPFYSEMTFFVADEKNRSNLVEQSKLKIARRTDGVTVHVQSLVPRNFTGFVREVDFRDGNKITLYDSLKVKSTWPKPEIAESNSIKQSLKPRIDCDIPPDSTRLGNGIILGQTTTIIRRTIGKYRLTQQLAPALACETLYYESELVNSNGLFSLTAKGATTVLKLGEPDASLFDPGLTYVETKPSNANSQLLQQMHVVLSATDAQTVQKENTQADWKYYSGDPNKPRWGGVTAAK